MLILTDYNRGYVLDSLSSPIIPKHFWIFSGPLSDFTLAPLTYLEETTGPSYTLCIEGLPFRVPAHWNILCVDPETFQIDTVPIASCAKKPFHAVMMSPTVNNMNYTSIEILDYTEEDVLIHPLIQKGCGLCHPIGDRNGKEYCIVASPYDLHKYLVDKTIGDIFP